MNTSADPIIYQGTLPNEIIHMYKLNAALVKIAARNTEIIDAQQKSVKQLG